MWHTCDAPLTYIHHTDYQCTDTYQQLYHNWHQSIQQDMYRTYPLIKSPHRPLTHGHIMTCAMHVTHIWHTSLIHTNSCITIDTSPSSKTFTGVPIDQITTQAINTWITNTFIDIYEQRNKKKKKEKETNSRNLEMLASEMFRTFKRLSGFAPPSLDVIIVYTQCRIIEAIINIICLEGCPQFKLGMNRYTCL